MGKSEDGDYCNVYSKNMIVVTRNDIELKERDDTFETKPCLEDYHIDSLNDFIENKMDDDTIGQDDKPIYILLHEMCDHVDDIKKLADKKFDIRSFIHISAKEKEEEDEAEQNEEDKPNDNAENEDNADVNPDTDKQEKCNVSADILSHFMNEANYRQHDC